MVSRRRNLDWLALLLLPIANVGAAAAEPPCVASDRYQLELVAAEPDIVTPIGMAFDRQGRLLVIESHTHQPQEDYQGPATDRVRMFADSDGDGRLDRWTTFAQGFRHAMNLLVRDDGAVYVVTRDQLILLYDTDNDGVGDRHKVLLRLETKDDYPHNALGGIDQTSGGSLIIGLGENHGLPFKLIGSDGKVFSATGGIDGFFRCSTEGKNITHFARGVWNPFSLCVLDDGRIFAVDNDPDASPPCRLLHVVEGGDYGYLYQYGRAGTHPLQCWDGELPGTLPMVCGTGEAPTAIVPHAGHLWVTSWGEYRIERYRLVPRGASYSAERDVIVQGDADFRPTGMAVAPDGSLYFGDWRLRNYPVHGTGRIWRLMLQHDQIQEAFPAMTEDYKNARSFRFGASTVASESADPFMRANGAIGFSRYKDLEKFGTYVPEIPMGAGLRLMKLEAWRLRGTERFKSILREALHDDSPDVRLFAVRWVADDRILELRDDVAKLLDGPQPDSRYYLAVLAAVDWLDHEPSMRSRDFADELLVRELQNQDRSPSAHALALGSLSPDNEFLSSERLQGYLESDFVPLRLEAVRMLAQQQNSKGLEILAGIAADPEQSDELRAEAIMGLAPAAEQHQELLDRLAGDDEATIQREAQRVLRLSKLRPVPVEAKPPASELAAWGELLDRPGDAAAGRRLFFSSVGARCAVCHQHGGRGGRIGPELTHLGRNSSRERIIASLLQPSQEVAPHYQPWLLTTSDGRALVGVRRAEGGDDGAEQFFDSAGEQFQLASAEIASRAAATTSIMPDGLEQLVSIEDLRDLVTFLGDDSQPR
jgi:putative membrane-bound dehydrogenase-like protein